MKPIIMSTEDVRALLDGRKTMIRRVINPRHGGDLEVHSDIAGTPRLSERCGDRCRGLTPPYEVGDVLWVRETWQHAYLMDDSDQIIDGTGAYLYAADGDPCFDYWVDPDTGVHKEKMPWKPSIYMPREAARLFLRVTDVRVERVQDISPEDCESEGYFEAEPVEPRPRSWFSAVWDARNAKRGHGWDTNPFCWVIEFERIEKGEELE